MDKPIAIIAGEPNSISSEIIFKSWTKRKRFKHKPIIVIGSIKLLNLQKKKLKYNFKVTKLKSNFKNIDLNNKALQVYDVNFNQKKPFENISVKSNNYIFNCFEVALKLIKKKKIIGLVNCPISKETLFKHKYQGITEFLSNKTGAKGNEVMLIYNNKLSVSPLTTHIPLKKVSKKISKLQIIKNVKTIFKFYRKVLKKNPHIGILGLNPHNFSSSKNPEEKTAIIPAIKAIKQKKINVTGPISPDTSFIANKKNKFDVILGMYHDQVLTPFKALFKYNAINITLGLPYIRISPDHGVAADIVGKKIANPNSLVEAIKFFNYIK